MGHHAWAISGCYGFPSTWPGAPHSGGSASCPSKLELAAAGFMVLTRLEIAAPSSQTAVESLLAAADGTGRLPAFFALTPSPPVECAGESDREFLPDVALPSVNSTAQSPAADDGGVGFLVGRRRKSASQCPRKRRVRGF